MKIHEKSVVIPMKRVFVKKIMAVLLLIGCLSITTAYADVTQDDIDNAKEEIDNLQEQKDEAEDAVDDISDKKDKYEDELNSLNEQMKHITASMNELEVRIAEKQEEIAEAEKNLIKAQERSDKQYEDMKLRIRFMYENGNASMLEMLLASESIRELLNRTEYISSINNYDRDMLKQFQELQVQIEEQKTALEEDETELLTMAEGMKEQQEKVNGLIHTAQANIEQTANELADAKSDVKALEKKIAKMEAYEQELELQKAREDAARLEAIKQQEAEDTSGVVYVPQESDQYLLGAIIQCEADSEPYEGKLAVGSVVMNRVKSSYFPNTVSGVIYQSGQFSPVASGRYAYRLEAGVNESCLKAAKEVLDGKITVKCLFFRRNNGIIQGTVIGNHVFY